MSRVFIPSALSHPKTAAIAFEGNRYWAGFSRSKSRFMIVARKHNDEHLTEITPHDAAEAADQQRRKDDRQINTVRRFLLAGRQELIDKKKRERELVLSMN